ncbi:MAG: hypothetical protein QOF61_3267, partial [Acidobacteriota bacterium]|nr:hypothetical protein [Acidobacteriota bacterium]
GLKYIETVPRRGYRFAADVTVAFDGGATERVLEEHTRAHILIEEEHDEGELSSYLSAEPAVATRAVAVRAGEMRASSRRRTATVVLASLALVCALALGALWLRPSRTESKSALLPFPAARTVPLTSFPDEEVNPALSPDGRLVAYSWKGGTTDRMNIYVQQVDAGTPLRLTTALAREGSPTWSPDGRYIAFVRNSLDASTDGIYLIPALGGHERQLAHISCVSLDWSPDGRSLAYAARDHAQETYGVSVLTVDSLDVRRLTSPPAGTFGDIHPVFSPDGQTLAFIRYTDDVAELFIMPAGGGEARQLTFDNRRIDGLVWTPDSRELVFSSNRSGGYNLWRMPAQGGEPVRVEGVGQDAHEPSVARTGGRLAYSQQSVDTNIWRVPLRGGAANDERPHKLVASSRRDENPRLSPDGQKIVFESNRSGARELWVCDGDGANQAQLTSFGGPVTANARWSPDGHWLAFESRPEGRAAVYVISSEGGPARRMTSGAGDSLAPSWSRDGHWLYFGSNRDGSWQVWKMPAGGGDAVRVTREGGYEAMESPDGQFLYYNKQGFYTVGLFRQPVAGGDEAMVIDLPQLESFGDWAATNEGVYYIHRYDGAGKHPAHFSINHFNFATRLTTQVAPLEHDPTSNPGLNLSPDGRSLIYSIDDYRNLDIMLVENFR